MTLEEIKKLSLLNDNFISLLVYRLEKARNVNSKKFEFMDRKTYEFLSNFNYCSFSVNSFYDCSFEITILNYRENKFIELVIPYEFITISDEDFENLISF